MGLPRRMLHELAAAASMAGSHRGLRASATAQEIAGESEESDENGSGSLKKEDEEAVEEATDEVKEDLEAVAASSMIDDSDHSS